MKFEHKFTPLAKTALIVIIALFVSAAAAISSEWPGREKFSEVPYVGSDVLHKGYTDGSFIIVDVRSTIEYNVIHPTDAKHISVSKIDFIKQVEKLRKENPDKKLAFYCNGTTCLKSYVATKKAMEVGMDNVFAYDAGIPEWVNMFPGETLLLGKVVTDPEKQIIPKSEFKKRTLSFEEFKAATETKQGIIVDVRSTIQRTEDLPGLGKTLKIPMNNFIANFIEKKKNQDKPLYIFDQVGKQVRWMEYYLIENGYTNYVFLKGGATSVLKDQKYKS
nr:rhodanese-like domain-containing protein [uncultured Desulfobacter sp.]